MTVINSDDAEAKAALIAANLMVASARTAPKALGVDKITAAIVVGEEKEKIADKMEEIIDAPIPKERLEKQAMNIRNADAVVLIGVKINGKADDFERTFRLVDLGIAIGSAVKTASLLNVDNRVMYTAGKAARDLKFIEGDVVFGIPIAIRGCNIFFDRYDPAKISWQNKLQPRRIKQKEIS